MMKLIHYLGSKTLRNNIVILLLLLSCVTIVNGQSFQMGNREYRFEDSEWFNYSTGTRGDIIIPHRMIVKLASGERPTATDFINLGISGANVISRRILGDYYVIEVDPNMDPFNIAQTLFQNSAFQYVEFDAIATPAVTPLDPEFPQQWNLDDTKLRMELTWDISTGSNSVILAIIDSGTEIDHEDLDDNIWNNNDESAGDSNGDGCPGDCYVDDDGDGLIDEDSEDCGSDGMNISGEPCTYLDDLDGDDDENGYIDDFVGWDFNDSDNTPESTSNHGTLVAGVAGAQTHNYENGSYRGVAGVAGGWGTSSGVNLMIMRYMSDPLYGPVGFVTSIAEGITYAAENGADVINISLGWYTFYPWFEEAVNIATNFYDLIIVAASHNDNGSIRYPAKYDNTIAVGATDTNDIRHTYSNYGPQLDVVAPAGVPTTDLNGGYENSFGGTSCATPHVAGLAALIRSVNPNLQWDEVRDVIRNTADKVPAMGGQDFTEYYGYGRINAFYAVAPPSAPTGLSISGSIGQSPTLNWNSNPEPDIKAFNIYRMRYGIDNDYVLIATVNAPVTSYTDNGITIYVGKFSAYVYYKIKADDFSNQLSPFSNWTRTKYRNQIEQKILQIPSAYALHTAYPNPFNPTTTIRFDLPERSRVSMVVYDILGRTVRTLIQNTIEPGFHEVIWGGKDNNGNSVSTGMYIYRFYAFSKESETQFARSQKIVLMK
ncbi:MAG: S8 family serine peptidase [Candidatus Marinimicrobia bacterium]|nr:S8 family serine peptidase [Candidatus Neomarinimicrobiota bacterium]